MTEISLLRSSDLKPEGLRFQTCSFGVNFLIGEAKLGNLEISGIHRRKVFTPGKRRILSSLKFVYFGFQLDFQILEIAIDFSMF